MKAKIDQIKLNQDNPRLAVDRDFLKFCQLIIEFPQETRWPIVANDQGVILLGKRLYQALLHLGHTEVDVMFISGLTAEQEKNFVDYARRLEEFDFGMCDNLDS